MGASAFSFVSPVKMPTLFSPNLWPNSTHFAFVRAFRGEAYQQRPPLSKMDWMACSAIQVFPTPVGAVTRQSVRLMASRAANWKGSGTKAVGVGLPILAKTCFNAGSISGFIWKRGWLFLDRACRRVFCWRAKYFFGFNVVVALSVGLLKNCSTVSK